MFKFVGQRGYLPFQTIAIVRRVVLSLFVASAQIAPQFRQFNRSTDSPEQTQLFLNQLAATMREIDGDAQRMLEMESSPFVGDETLEPQLKNALVNWLVQNEVRNTPEVQRAIKRVVERKNEEQLT
jgi:hypothetical protein